MLVLAAVFFYWRSTFTEDTDDAQVDGNLYQVSSRIAGQVIKVYVDDNQTVQGATARGDRSDGLPGCAGPGGGEPGQCAGAVRAGDDQRSDHGHQREDNRDARRPPT